MITCSTFRATFPASSDDALVLEHLRSCDPCLAFAVEHDPDVMFRAVGGGELVPPGGLDAFVGDVMREVRLRSTERSVAVKESPAWRRMAIAAALSAVVTGGAFFYQRQLVLPGVPLTIERAAMTSVIASARPVVEKYESDTATIIEVPTVAGEDVQVVMVFDESLPADL